MAKTIFPLGSTIDDALRAQIFINPMVYTYKKIIKKKEKIVKYLHKYSLLECTPIPANKMLACSLFET